MSSESILMKLILNLLRNVSMLLGKLPSDMTDLFKNVSASLLGKSKKPGMLLLMLSMLWTSSSSYIIFNFQTIQNILRKYPSKYNFDGMFVDLVALFEYASEPESERSAVWILGEYAEEIYQVSMETFKKWIENFTSKDRIVQLEIISSAVKVYIKYPEEFETLISDLLTIATEQVDNPDVRDRAFIYWRMLSTDPAKTKDVVFGYRPQARSNDKLMDKKFLD